MATTCQAHWCVALPIPGSVYCAAHAQVPPLHSWESEKDWKKRSNALHNAQKRAAKRAAESDATLSKRGTNG